MKTLCLVLEAPPPMYSKLTVKLDHGEAERKKVPAHARFQSTNMFYNFDLMGRGASESSETYFKTVPFFADTRVSKKGHCREQKSKQQIHRTSTAPRAPHCLNAAWNIMHADFVQCHVVGPFLNRTLEGQVVPRRNFRGGTSRGPCVGRSGHF